MASSDRNQKDKPRGNEPNFNWRGVILIAIAFALIGLAVLFRGGAYQTFEDVPYNRFLELLDSKQIVNDKNYPLQLVVEDGRPTQTLRGYYLKQGTGGAPTQQVPFRTTIYLNYNTNLTGASRGSGNSAGYPHGIECSRANAGRISADCGFPGRSLSALPPANSDGR